MNFNVHTGKLGPYDAIIGRRTVQDIGIIHNFKQNNLGWSRCSNEKHNRIS